MERFRDLKKMVESKDSIINKMDLTDEQKDIAKEFFNKHNDYEKEVDWNKWRTLTWEDLSEVIYKDRSRATKQQVKKSIKKGLEGFTEGEDYDILDEGELNGFPYVAYIPHTWEASRTIASTYVEPCDVEAKWCTAYQKTDEYWKLHNMHERFIYYCGEGIPSKKVAVSVEIGDHEYDGNQTEYYMCTGVGRGNEGKTKVNYNLWNADDERAGDYISWGGGGMPNNMENLIISVRDSYWFEAEDTPWDVAVGKYGEEAVNAFEHVFGDDVPYEDMEIVYIGEWSDMKDFVAETCDWCEIMDCLDYVAFADNEAEELWNDEEKFRNFFGVSPDEYDKLSKVDKKEAVDEYLNGVDMTAEEAVKGFLYDFILPYEYLNQCEYENYDTFYFSWNGNY